MWSEYLYNKALENGECEAADDEKWICGIWGDIDNTDCANAKRIANVPKMESRIISDYQLLKAADELLKSVIHEREMVCQDIDMQLELIKSVDDAIVKYKNLRETPNRQDEKDITKD